MILFVDDDEFAVVPYVEALEERGINVCMCSTGKLWLPAARQLIIIDACRTVLRETVVKERQKTAGALGGLPDPYWKVMDGLEPRRLRPDIKHKCPSTTFPGPASEDTSDPEYQRTACICTASDASWNAQMKICDTNPCPAGSYFDYGGTKLPKETTQAPELTGADSDPAYPPVQPDLSPTRLPPEMVT